MQTGEFGHADQPHPLADIGLQETAGPAFRVERPLVRADEQRGMRPGRLRQVLDRQADARLAFDEQHCGATGNVDGHCGSIVVGKCVRSVRLGLDGVRDLTTDAHDAAKTRYLVARRQTERTHGVEAVERFSLIQVETHRRRPRRPEARRRSTIRFQ